MRTFRTLILTILIALGAAAPGHASLRVTVRAGDSLAAIGDRHGVSAQAIASANGIRNPALVGVGTSLWIPGGSSSRASASHAPSASSSGGVHMVAAGESLGSIAARYGTSASALARANGIANPNLVIAGTRLRVTGLGSSTVTSSRWTGSATSGGTHTVAPGESLGSIAARYGTTAAALARANAIRNPNLVVAGSRLTVPGGGATSATAPATSSQTANATSAAGTHTVASGENLASIAARYGTTAAALARANGIADPNRIVAGTRLIVGASSPGAPPAGPLTPITAATAGWGAHPGSDEVRSLIDAAAARQGVDPALVRAIAWQESGYWQGARSSTGAIGVMQLMPDTATWAGSSLLGRAIDPTNVRDNIEAGTAYIAYLQRNAATRDQAIAGYYQGLGSVTSRGLYDDTKQYVTSVNGHYGRR